MRAGSARFAAAVVVCALAAGVGVAAGDDGNALAPDSQPDTQLTPSAKDPGNLWHQVAGAHHPDAPVERVAPVVLVESDLSPRR